MTVLSLSTDPVALALGPLLAAFASAQGISYGPGRRTPAGHERHGDAAHGMRGVAPSAAGRGRPLQLLVSEDGRLGQIHAAFVVVVAVVDGQHPRIPDTARTSATVLGVSAGKATAEQLAQAATAASVDGREIYGILVANPDPDDQTSGRIPRLTLPGVSYPHGSTAYQRRSDGEGFRADNHLPPALRTATSVIAWRSSMVTPPSMTGSSAGNAPGLVSVGFLRSALRRRARLWCALALVGLIIGGGYATVKPPKYTASTTVLLVDKPQADPTSAITTDIALAESIPVAAAAVSQLGLNQTPASFLATYSVKQVTTQVLSITASGPSSSAAVQRASAIATQYLAYRAKYEQATAAADRSRAPAAGHPGPAAA